MGVANETGRIVGESIDTSDSGGVFVVPARFIRILVGLWLLCLVAGTCSAVQLRFIVPGGATTESSRYYYNLAREFELAEPGIKVELIPLPAWDKVIDKVSELASQGHDAGLFVAEVSQTLELEKLGLIQPFDAVLAEQGINANDFLMPISRQYMESSYCASGKLCGPPFFRSMPVAFYNLDQLKSAGIPISDLPLNWAELEEVLEKIKRQSGKPPFVLGGDWYDWIFEATVIQAGGSLMTEKGLNLANPAAIKALGFWKRLKDKGLLLRVPGWKDTIKGFMAGRYAVIYYSTGGMEGVRANSHFSWMADMMPKDVMYGATLGGGNLYFSANMSPEVKSAAVKFVRFLYQPSIQASTSKATGYLPVVETAYSESALRERYLSDEPFVRAKKQLRFAKTKFMAPDNLKVRRIIKTAIDQCLDSGVTPELALRRAQQEVDKLDNR